MRSLFAWLFPLVLTAVSVAQQPSTAPRAVTDPKALVSTNVPDLTNYDLSKFFMTRTVGASSWSSDGKSVVLVTNISGRHNLWMVPAAGGWPQQLTISDQRQTNPAWSPDGQWIAFQSDKDGNEQWDVFVVSPKNGDVVNLTNTAEVSEESPTWQPHGRLLAITVRPKDASTAEIATLDVLTHRVRKMTKDTPKDRFNSGPIWSPDGKQIAFTQALATGKDSNVFVVDIASGKATNLTPHTGEHLYSASAWAPNGKKLLISSDAGNGYQNVALLDPASKQIQWLTKAKFESEAGSYSADGKQLTWTTNFDGNQTIFVYDVATQHAQALPLKPGVNAPAGSETAFSKDGKQLLYKYSGPDSPGDLWVYSLATRHTRQLTNSMVAGLRPADMVAPTLVHYPSHDGKFQISAFVYMPHNIIKNAQYPALVYVHGGPASQFDNSFNPFVQYIANQGYIVIAPNYRGSTGYGKQFQEADFFDMGGGDLQDVVSAADFIKQNGYVNPKKLIIMGRSYGGYLTMMGVTKAPEVWAAGVAVVPFVNWFTEVQNEDPLLREIDYATMGDPVKDKALWEDRSPMNFIKQIKAPLLIVAGGNDPRCPKSEAQQLAEAIKKNGGTVQLKIYEDEGHVFGRMENTLDYFKRVSDFLKVQVPSPGCGCELVQ